MKFRAYDTVLKRMLTQDEVDKYPLEALMVSETVIFDEFSGYLDRNKKEIYEKDMLEDLERDRYSVIFSQGTFVAHRPGAWKPLRMFAGHCDFYARVIGNDHENTHMTLVKEEEC